MPGTPHIAFYIPSLTVGGAQRVTVDTANGLNERGFNIDLVLSYKEGRLIEYVNDGVEIICLNSKKIPLVGIGSSIFSFAKYLRDASPDILFSQMTYSNVVMYRAKQLSQSKTEFIGVEHNTFKSHPKKLKSKLITFLATRQYRHHHLVAVSEGVKESVIENTEATDDNVTVLHNPIDVRTIQNKASLTPDHPWLKGNEKVILSVGRLAPPKDFETLIRAFKLVQDSMSRSKLIVAGTGPKKEELELLAEELGISEHVDLPGYVENVYSYMGHSSVFVLSSYREGLPTVLIEALACGCSVVSTDCPSGPNEILCGGKYGHLTPVGDSTTMAEKIINQLNSSRQPELAKSRAEDFSIQNSINEYEIYIKNIIEPN